MKVLNLTPNDIEMEPAELVAFLKKLPSDMVRDSVAKSGHMAELLRFAPDQEIIEAFKSREPSIGLVHKLQEITMGRLAERAGEKKLEVA